VEYLLFSGLLSPVLPLVDNSLHDNRQRRLQSHLRVLRVLLRQRESLQLVLQSLLLGRCEVASFLWLVLQDVR